ncbi:type III PLP-dependent enzyme [Nonomuraea aridisoli]|uniref:ornithine decarboxylase n=1 Tax=Nonomuraea aridisoli TaxID=2070368 RepID=A0A2W2EMQ4_9ACTN|nr:type III PLP-dependent enzyme [Nonomuraea aridisoli]PZG18039.1 ornithine decarboxylase [Nonomuraea aridisoli]
MSALPPAPAPPVQRLAPVQIDRPVPGSTRDLDDARDRSPVAETPLLVIDLRQIRSNAHAIAAAFSGMDPLVYYAVKANPAPEILSTLAAAGCRFDIASLGEARAALAAGAPAGHLAYTTTIKKAGDIRAAYELGVTLYTADSPDEIDKISAAAPGAWVAIRIAVDNTGAAAPFGSKFGCAPEQAADLLRRATRVGLIPAGVSCHVGSQQLDVHAWDKPIAAAASIYRAFGGELPMLNLGGGLPATYTDPVPAVGRYAAAISQSLDRHFGASRPHIILEPGRAIAASAGVIHCEVVQVTHRHGQRWVYLDVGRYGGLAETEGEAIRYPMHAPDVGGPLGPVIVAGPTADGDDVLYHRYRPELPLALRAGDRVVIGCTGAYTASYAAVSFNGLPPLAVRCAFDSAPVAWSSR